MTPPFGVYVHIPFCTRRCDYCAFAAWDDRGHLIDSYVDAVVAEAAGAAAELPAATSVFFGGGTPSLLTPDQLASILTGIRLAGGAEVTVECNPETVTVRSLSGYRHAGVNRISLGVQSLSRRVLHALGRRHESDAVAPAVEAVRAAGFDNFNLDLIYGAAGETLAEWDATLRAVVALGPPHVSAYALTVEPGTPLALDPERHPDADLQADMYLLATDVLGAAGLEWYEISNWAAPGRECRHNLLYWEQGNYRGLGCAAHSHHNGRRWWNVRTPERYMGAAGAAGAAGATPLAVEAASEMVVGPARSFEALSLALRTRRGVPVGALGDLDLLVDAGLVVVVDGNAVLTARGRLMANEVAARLRAPVFARPA